MTTYEEQCFKWAKKRFPNEFAYDSVKVDTSVYSYREGCPTCGPETEMSVDVYFYSNDQSVGYKSIDIRYGEGFAQILKEIIEA